MGKVAGDADLVTGNIKSGVNIFGVVGKTEVVDTTEASTPASAGDLLAGQVAYVNGSKITGSMLTRTLSDSSTTVNAGYYATTGLATVDSDLASDNIKASVNIFGVAGKTEVVDTTEASTPASAGDLLAGQVAYVNGSKITGSMLTRTLSDSSTTVNAGYYATTGLATVDSDLASDNIKASVNIFGVAGKTEVVDTTEASTPASAGDLLAGQVAYVNGSKITGSMLTRTLSDSTTTVNAGYYATTGLATVDSDLASDNIKASVNIFGVAGKTEVVDTTEASTPASAGDLLAGQVAYVNGSKITGSMLTRTLSDSSTTVNAGYYATTDLAAVDSDLATGNIKASTEIFGVAGDSNVVDTSSGDAEAGDIASGKTAWVDGTEVTGTAYPASVPKSGQTTSYATGDDGDLQSGVIQTGDRFSDNGDGTITDNLTGLIWLKNANCFGASNWANALTSANNLSTGNCGLSDGSSAGDWRLPTRNELASLVNSRYNNPALSNADGNSQWTTDDPFTGVQSGSYWSSTTFAGYTANAWNVGLDNGNVLTSVKTVNIYVWPVRGGQ